MVGMGGEECESVSVLLGGGAGGGRSVSQSQSS